MIKVTTDRQYIALKRAENGYLCELYGPYGADSQAHIFPSFLDAIIAIAEGYGESDFVNTLRETHEVSKALEGFFGKILAPKLLAIEAKLNPGVETIVDDISF